MSEFTENAYTGIPSLDKIISYCEVISFPTAIFNSNLECVYSKKWIIKKNAKADVYLKENDTFVSKDYTSTIFFIDGTEYCANILRCEDFYLCSLYNSRELFRMAKNTDFFQKMIPNIEVLQYSLAHLWDDVSKVKDLGNAMIAADMEKYMFRLYQILKDAIEFFKSVLIRPSLIRVECCSMLEKMIFRCNTFLATCGRHIEFYRDLDNCYISADNRHVFCAFINAIQNSLLYSTNDCIPKVSVYKGVVDNKSYVFVKIINNNRYFADDKKNLYDNEVSRHKVGFGMHVIENLIEETGGECSYDTCNGTTTLLMKIPALKDFANNAIVFEADGFGFYETGIPDYIELKMRDVIELTSSNCFQ